MDETTTTRLTQFLKGASLGAVRGSILVSIYNLNPDTLSDTLKRLEDPEVQSELLKTVQQKVSDDSSSFLRFIYALPVSVDKKLKSKYKDTKGFNLQLFSLQKVDSSVLDHMDVVCSRIHNILRTTAIENKSFVYNYALFLTPKSPLRLGTFSWAEEKMDDIIYQLNKLNSGQVDHNNLEWYPQQEYFCLCSDERLMVEDERKAFVVRLLRMFGLRVKLMGQISVDL